MQYENPAETPALAAVQAIENLLGQEPPVVIPEGQPAASPVRGLAELALMWPGGRRAFLADLDVRVRDFTAWADGRGELEDEAVTAICRRAQVRRAQGRMELAGGCLLVAARPKPLIQLYNALTARGDVSLSREIVSPSGRPADWRFLLFQRNGARPCIVLVEPGSLAGAMLSPRHLANFAGRAVATPEVWNSVQFMVRNHEMLRAPGTAGVDFEAMHGRWMKSLYTM